MDFPVGELTQRARQASWFREYLPLAISIILAVLLGEVVFSYFFVPPHSVTQCIPPSCLFVNPADYYTQLAFLSGLYGFMLAAFLSMFVSRRFGPTITSVEATGGTLILHYSNGKSKRYNLENSACRVTLFDNRNATSRSRSLRFPTPFKALVGYSDGFTSTWIPLTEEAFDGIQVESRSHGIPVVRDPFFPVLEGAVAIRVGWVPPRVRRATAP